MTHQQRVDDMLARYGEVVPKTVAASILHRSVFTIRNMIADGRLQSACAGDMVDMRSIVDYIYAPEQADRSARYRKRFEKTGCQFHV